MREIHTIIPVFGEADLAERSIDSALAQDYLEKKITVALIKWTRDESRSYVRNIIQE